MKTLTHVYGIPEDVTSIWIQEEGNELLEIQKTAIENFGLLQGKSIIITAPSSSGKTFVGEIAAVHAYFSGKKTLFLVPMKAIAEEKYADFVRKYRRFGINVVISTHDRTEFDSNILAGYFDIAVIIFEKMNVLLTQSAAVLNSCGLVIVDELQLLNERERGPGLEILLTKIKVLKEASKGSFQFLGLSAVLADLNQFDIWLNAQQCESKMRPLELHEGVLSPNGTLKVQKFNDGTIYEEKLPEIDKVVVPSSEPMDREESDLLQDSILHRLLLVCRHYLKEGKRILIFRKWRALAVSTAQFLSRELSLRPASKVISVLEEIENTNSHDVLTECLAKGIAFHNSDLLPETRLTIEDDFRSNDGQIKVVCSTSTLAMGVNLPCSIVIIPDALKPDPDAEAFHEIPITTSEYKNMSGRAGRTRFKEEGVSILLANSQAEAAKFWKNYVQGRLDTLSPSLVKRDLRKIMLDLFAGELCKTEEELQKLLLSSFTGFVHWNRTHSTREGFIAVIAGNCQFLLENNLVKRTGKAILVPTDIGKLCAASGVEIESFILLSQNLHRIVPADWVPWQIIFICLHCAELTNRFKVTFRRVDQHSVWRVLEERNPKNHETLCSWSRELLNDTIETVKRVQTSMLLVDWINGMEMRDLENSYTSNQRDRFLSGAVRDIASIVAWMTDSMRRIAQELKYDKEFCSALRILSERIARGVPAEGIELHKLGVRGITRTVIKRLVDAKLANLDSILEARPESFRGIISPHLAQRIQEAIVRNIEESLEYTKRSQIIRIEKQGRDSGMIKGLYELEGIRLEDAVVELLNSPPLGLGAKRMSKQKEGEPDIRLVLPDGILVGSVTASKSPISDKKCAEIIRSGAKMNPTSFVVFGRPGFHKLATDNSPHVNAQLDSLKSYKLISMPDLGELFVAVVEGKINKTKFVEILMKSRGLILAQKEVG